MREITEIDEGRFSPGEWRRWVERKLTKAMEAGLAAKVSVQKERKKGRVVAWVAVEAEKEAMR